MEIVLGWSNLMCESRSNFLSNNRVWVRMVVFWLRLEISCQARPEYFHFWSGYVKCVRIVQFNVQVKIQLLIKQQCVSENGVFWLRLEILDCPAWPDLNIFILGRVSPKPSGSQAWPNWKMPTTLWCLVLSLGPRLDFWTGLGFGRSWAWIYK